jgi:hypothetical protein
VFDDVERYFDRLDAAFATLGKEPPKTEPAAPDVPDLPLSYASPQQAFEEPPTVEREPEPPAVAIAPASQTAAPPEKIAIADAFAALLAAEQRDPASAAAPEWPAMPPPAIATDDLVERVSRRVLDQLSDRVVRETVGQLVSTIAERLVREEIERLKSSIK